MHYISNTFNSFFKQPPRISISVYTRLLHACLTGNSVFSHSPCGIDTTSMDNFEERWHSTEEMLKERFGKLPDMEGILFLIGVNELGKLPARKFSKEQKQDLMHVAVCTLLSPLGYYEYAGLDADGWPHYNEVEQVPVSGLANQEQMLKQCIIEYFGH